MPESYEFESELWEWEARKEKWVFASLPPEISAQIADQPHPPAGFRSVKVRVRLGASVWSTSIFLQAANHYVVPIKKAIRERHGVDTGDTVTIGLELLQ